ncbi:MAG: hypothetical protein KKA67_10110 [Spirochaetes bacterium]|nr:hypothetical protein [Spirochaetota bacterium]MBU1082066.1 hypothetical protein [Spirochaetota bacterium]
MIQAGHLALASFIVGLGAVGAAAVFGSTGTPARPSERLSFADGKAGAELVRRLEAEIPFRKAAISAFATVRYDAFGEGYRGVVVGDDGWLFSSEEFDPDLSRAEGFLEGSFEDALAAARDRLAARGVSLVVALVPSKSRIYPDKLGGSAIPPAIEARYENLALFIEGLGVPVVDLAAALSSARAARSGGAEPFLRSDSHWTPEGAAAAAAAIAGRVASLGLVLPGSEIIAEDEGSETREGDLMAFLPGRGATLRPLPPPERISAHETFADSGAGLFGSQAIPVALVGTSYSAEPAWHFEGFLKRALGADVMNLAESGKGPFEPMRAALAGGEIEANGTLLVVWEIPERYVAP